MNFLFCLFYSNNLTWKWSESNSGLYTIYVDNKEMANSNNWITFFRVNRGSERYLGKNNKGIDFFEGILVETNIYKSEEENIIFFDYTVHNNGTSLKTIDLVSKIYPHASGADPLINPHSYFRGHKFTDIKDNRTLNVIIEDDDWSNGNLVWHGYYDYDFKFKSYNYLGAITWGRYYFFGFINKKVDVGETLHLRYKMDDGSRLDPEPVVFMDYQMKDCYSFGENVTVFGRTEGKMIGQTIETYYRLDNVDRLISTFTVEEDSNSTSFEFNVTMENHRHTKEFYIWAVCNNTIISNMIAAKFQVTHRPKFNMTNKLNSFYGKSSYFIIHGYIWDDSNAFIYYKYDNQNEIKLDSIIYCNNKNVYTIKNIQIDDKLSIGKHNITIYVRDDQGAKSDAEEVFEFEFTNLNAPTLSVWNIKTYPQAYLYHHRIIPQISSNDLDIGDNITIWMRVYNQTEDDYQMIANYTSNKSEQRFSYNFNYPVDGVQTLSFYASDQNNLNSKEIDFSLYIHREKGYWSPITVKYYYVPGEIVNLSGYFYDFEPGHLINITYRRQDENQIYPDIGPAKMGDNYISDTLDLVFPAVYPSAHYYIKGIDLNDSSVCSERYYNIPVNHKPIIYSTTDFEKTYPKDGIIEFTQVVWDDTYVYCKYKFDNGYVRDLDGHINCYSKNQTITKRINLDWLKLNLGEHNLTIFLSDFYGATSNEIFVSFIVDNRRAPTLEVIFTNSKNPYRFHDVPTFRLRSNDLDIGNNVSIYVYINESEPILIWNYTSDGRQKEMIYPIDFIKENGYHSFIFYAIDDTNTRSPNMSIGFKMERFYEVHLTKRYNGWYVPGSIINIKGKVYDFDPGDNITLCLNLGKEILMTNESDFVMPNNYTIEFDINFTTPKLHQAGVYHFYATNGSTKTNNWAEDMRITEAPKFYDVEPLDEEYSINEYITFKAKIWDEQYVTIYYKFDERESKRIEWKETKGNNISIRYQIPTQENVFTLGMHTLRIYLVDDYGFWSEQLKYDFEYQDLRAPEISIVNSDNKQVYGFHEKVHFKGKMRDLNYGDHISINLKINDGEPFSICNITSNREWQIFEWEYEVPNIAAEYKFVFIAVDSTNSSSGEIEISFKVVQTPEVIITSSIDKMYDPGTIINITGYVGDFNPGNEVTLYYRINNNKDEYPIDKLIMYENYSSEFFTFEITLPNFPNRNSIYFFARDNTSISAKRAILYTTTNLYPHLISWDSIKEEYANNEFIDIDALISDDSRFKIYYKFDSGTEAVLNEWISHSNDKIHKQIPIGKNKLSGGKHKLTIWIKDEYDCKSNEMSQEFNYNDKHAPELKVSLLSQRSSYGFYESAMFIINASDYDEGNNVKVFLKVNNSNELSEVFDFDSNGNWTNSEFFFEIPNINGIANLLLFAIDNTNAKSNDVIFNLKVQQNPSVVMTTEIEPFYNPGQKISLSGFVSDFNIGQLVQVFYKINCGSRFYATPLIKINDNYITDVFTFEVELPDSVGRHGIQIWAEDETQMSSSSSRIYAVTNVAPKIVSYNPILSNYSKNGFINFDAIIWDDSQFRVIYNYDTSDKVTLNEWHTGSRDNTSIHVQIPVGDKLTVGEHNLFVHIIDNYGLFSESINFKFTYDNRTAPELSVQMKNKKDTFSFFEKLEFRISSRDIDESELVQVSMKIDEQERIIIREFTSSENYEEFEQIIDVPHTTGKHRIIFEAIDSNTASSGEKVFNFNTYQTPSVFITSEFEQFYPPNTTISLSGYVADFNPGSEVQVYYRINDGITVYATMPLIINDNYTSDIFTFNFTSPLETRRNSIVIWAIDNISRDSKHSHYTITTNIAPEIIEWKPIKEIYSINEHIEFDAIIKDDSNCKIWYWFDNLKEKYINENIAIKSNDFPIRRQIPIESTLVSGIHNLSVILKDEFGGISNKITYEFNYTDNHAPEVTLVPLPNRGEYNFFENITIKGSVRDLDPEDSVHVHFFIGSSNKTLIYDSVSDGDWHDFTHTFRVPAADGIHTISIVASDDKLSFSKETTMNFNVKRNPVIRFDKGFEKSYRPNSTAYLTSYLTDFIPNSTVYLYFSIDGYEKQFITPINIPENMISDHFSYEIPLQLSMGGHYIILWVENEYNHVICPYSENFIAINSRPIFNITNVLNPSYFGHAFIDIESTVYDESDVYLYYRIDDSNENRVPGVIESFYIEEYSKRQIEIPAKSISYGQHILYVYVKDEFDSSSDVYNFTFEYINKFTPELRVKYNHTGYSYGFFETIKIDCEVLDKDIDDIVSIFIRYNFDEYIKIEEYKSTGSIYNFTYNIEIPLTEGYNTVTIQARDTNGANSKDTIIEFDVYRNPLILMSQNLKQSYKPNENIILSGCLVDFEPGDLFSIYYVVDDNERVLVGNYIINENYKSEEFVVDFLPPQTSIIHSLNLFAVHEQRTVSSIDGNFIVNFNPTIELMNTLNDKYFNNGYIDIDIKAWDNTRAKVCYKFDGREEKIAINYLNFYDTEMELHQQIKVDINTIEYGSHIIEIYAKDEFGSVSDLISHEFDFQDFYAPELIIESFERKDLYNFHENITVRGKCRSKNIGSTIKVSYRLNFSEYVTMHSLEESDGEWSAFEYTFKLPQDECNYFIIFVAKDEHGVSSRETRHDFRIKRQKRIILRNSLQNHYKAGEEVSIIGYVGDFDPGTQLRISYQLIRDERTLSSKKLNEVTTHIVGDYVVKEDMTTDDFNFLIVIPESISPQSFKIFAESLGNIVATFDDGYHVINLQPRMKITNQVNQYYFNKGFIDLDLVVWDNTRLKVWYCIDGGKEINLTDYIDCNNIEVEVNDLQIELPPGYLAFGPHTLYVFVRDEFGAESSDKVYDFMMIDQHAPDMEILSIDKKETYEFHEVITLRGRVRDIDPGDLIFVNLQVNRLGYTEIFRTIATGDWQNFSYTFNVPKNDGLYIVTFQAKDNWTANSRIEKYPIRVRRSRGVTLRRSTSMPRYYVPGSTVSFGGYVSDFVPQTKVRVSYSYGRSGTNFYIDVFTIHNSMTSDEFNVKFKLPDDMKDKEEVFIWVEDNETGDPLGNISFPIEINEDPTFTLSNSIKERYYGHIFIDLDMVLWDDYSAYICYQIDDGDEINLTDFIECNRKDQNIRRQIEIKEKELSYNRHSISIWTVDSYGVKSNVTTRSFLYYNLHSPEIEVEDIEQRNYYINEKITIRGRIRDLDHYDTVRVMMRFNTGEFNEISSHETGEGNWIPFTHTFNVPRNIGANEIIFQSVDQLNANSRDVIVKVNIIKHNFIPPRRPEKIPSPTPIISSNCQSTITDHQIFSSTVVKDINGDDYITYIGAKTTVIYCLNYDSIEDTEESLTNKSEESPFFETSFGKYGFWPIIVIVLCIIGGLTFAAIYYFILKKSEDSSSNNEEEKNEALPMQEETVQSVTLDGAAITNDNPLFVENASNDDIFADDFRSDSDGVANDNDNVDPSSEEIIQDIEL